MQIYIYIYIFKGYAHCRRPLWWKADMWPVGLAGSQDWQDKRLVTLAAGWLAGWRFRGVFRRNACSFYSAWKTLPEIVPKQDGMLAFFLMVLMSCGLTLSGILLILVTFWFPNRLLGYFDPTWTPHVAPGLEKYRFLMVFGPHLGGHLAFWPCSI